MGYLYCAISIFAFAVLCVSYKISGRMKCEKRHVNFFLFLSAGLMLLAWSSATGRFASVSFAPLMGIALGIVNYYAVMLCRDATAKGRVSTTMTVVNLALVVPAVVSVLLWHETPSMKQYIGFGLIIISIVLLGMDMERSGE